MGSSSIGRVLSLARQGVEIGLEYGPHSLEALLWIAETVEESVYEPGSLVRDPEGIRFTLGNPPLRMGAFSAFRLRWDGRPVDPALLRIRTGLGGSWRTAASVTADAPIELLPGVRIEVAAEVPQGIVGSSAVVRLELQCPAIPPLVWVEFRDTLRGG